ncbi:MAG: T9SS C-terminal target domain-containing protein [Haliscomenobacteraceae bacterium CHB4]|nr:hypothetical protein [Saprospiraceae bacterium]MCE7922975.1 T9SS C-terminal target domain-containing protein [Haliscomenobacteraceae bacterium CHB4]
MRLFSIIFSLVLAYANPLQAQTANATAPVKFSLRGGLFSGPVGVVLSCTTYNATIHYTTDGTEPTVQSPVYPNSILILYATTVLRARAFAPGLEPSPMQTHTYFIDLNHKFPVVSLVFDPAAFFDSLTGIYANYSQDLNAVANIEFFENDLDTAAFNQLVEIEIQGTGSASLPQKSLEIKAKNSLGSEYIPYAIFPDLPYEEYKRFVLRNGGQDWCVMQFRDEFATSLLSDRSDLGSILQSPALLLQAWRPAVVYLNGQYWGIHNVRERMNRFYVRHHFDWEEDAFDMIENYNDVSSGDAVAWFQFFDYLWQTEDGFENDAVFDVLKQKIDYQNFLDYCIFNIYLENEDWPGNNLLRFRHRSEEGKWRWMTYDLDFTFGLYQSNGGWNTGDPSPNALARLLDDTSMMWPNPDWATLLFRRCWQNVAFRRDFANRLADMLNTAFLPQRVCARLDEFRDLYQPEITRHFERWWSGNYDDVWLQNIEKTRYFAFQRPAFARQEIIQNMTEAYDSVRLTVDVFPPGGGRVAVSTVRPNGTQFPWTGNYFKGVPVPVKATANPGYTFTGWSENSLGTVDSVDLSLTDATFLVAHFQLSDSTISSEIPVSPAIPLRVYPNPVSRTLGVTGGMLEQGPVQVRICNGIGQTLLQTAFSANATGSAFLEVPAWPGGVYFLKITGENGASEVRRFVKK